MVLKEFTTVAPAQPETEYCHQSRGGCQEFIAYCGEINSDDIEQNTCQQEDKEDNIADWREQNLIVGEIDVGDWQYWKTNNQYIDENTNTDKEKKSVFTQKPEYGGAEQDDKRVPAVK